MLEQWYQVEKTPLVVSSLGRVKNTKTNRYLSIRQDERHFGRFQYHYKKDGKNINTQYSLHQEMEKYFQVKFADKRSMIAVYPDGTRVDVISHQVLQIKTSNEAEANLPIAKEDFNINDLQVVEYKGQRVLTTAQLAQAYECSEKRISENFNRNANRFIEGKHFFKVNGKELENLQSAKSGTQIPTKIRTLYLWTRRGASRHCKMLNTDKAWQMFDSLEDNYFDKGEQASAPAVAIMQLLANPRNAAKFLQAYADAKDENKQLLIENAAIKAENENVVQENMALQTSVERQNIEISDLKDQVAVEKFFKVDTDKLYSVTSIAIPYEKSAKWLNCWLETKGIQFYSRSAKQWVLNRKYRGRDLAVTTQYEYQEGKYRACLKWTKKGLSFIVARLREDGYLPVAAKTGPMLLH